MLNIHKVKVNIFKLGLIQYTKYIVYSILSIQNTVYSIHEINFKDLK